MSPTAIERLRDMLREAEFLSSHTAGLAREEFLADPVLQRAFVRSCEIIGEAARKVPVETRLALPAVEWRKLTGMRAGSYIITAGWTTTSSGTWP